MKNTIAVSTWSLHNHIGISFANGPGLSAPFVKSETWGNGAFDLFGVPAALAQQGYYACEICHFHIGSLALDYIKELRAAFDAAGVVIQTLLIDDGDISYPEEMLRKRDMDWIETWLDAASLLGAKHARVIAGKQIPSDAALALSVAGLQHLHAYGAARGVAVVTENWLDLTPSPVEVHHLLDHVPGLGLMCDTGNWSGPTKYADLQSIFPRATLCHAKAEVGAGHKVNALDFEQCLTAAKNANYTGPMTLIFHDDGDEWLGLDAERVFIQKA